MPPPAAAELRDAFAHRHRRQRAFLAVVTRNPPNWASSAATSEPRFSGPTPRGRQPVHLSMAIENSPLAATNSPLVAIFSPRWRPRISPPTGLGGSSSVQGFDPLAGSGLGESVAVLAFGDQDVGVVQ